MLAYKPDNTLAKCYHAQFHLPRLDGDHTSALASPYSPTPLALPSILARPALVDA